MSGIEDAGKEAAKKVAAVAGEGLDTAKNAAGGAVDAVSDAAGAGLDAAKGALGAVGGMLGGLAGKASKLAEGAVDAAKDAVDGVADKAGDLAGSALDAAKGAAGSVGDAVGNVADNIGDAAKGALGAVGNVAGGAADMAGDAADKIGGAGVAAVGAGAAVLGGAAAGIGNLGKGALGGVTGAMGLTGGLSGNGTNDGGGSSDSLPPIGARLDAAERDNAGPSIFLPILGVLGLGALAYFGFQTITKGNGTLFPEKVAAPVAAVAPAAAGLPAWLSGISGKLKAAFAWLTLGISGNSVIASGEADTQAAKDNALKEVTLAVKATPEGANSDIIDNIKVKGSTDTPVGAALAALGANPTAANCNTAFGTTMAGRTINFSTGGASIGGDNASLLNTLTAVANACKAHRIEVSGHTDSVGKPESNQALSQKRADAVKSYWTGKGVAAEGLVAKGFGETKPVEAVADETANVKNRRIEFAVTDAVAAAPVAPK